MMRFDSSVKQLNAWKGWTDFDVPAYYLRVDRDATNYSDPRVEIQIVDNLVRVDLLYSCEDWIPEEHETIEIPGNCVYEECFCFDLRTEEWYEHQQPTEIKRCHNAHEGKLHLERLNRHQAIRSLHPNPETILFEIPDRLDAIWKMLLTRVESISLEFDLWLHKFAIATRDFDISSQATRDFDISSQVTRDFDISSQVTRDFDISSQATRDFDISSSPATDILELTIRGKASGILLGKLEILYMPDRREWQVDGKTFPEYTSDLAHSGYRPIW